MKNSRWLWPNAKRIAVVFNVCLEAWSDGKAPGISPMGNPLAPGVLDTMAISWAAYGVRTGIYRLLDAFDRRGAKASVMVSAVIAERAPEAVRAIAQRGHEVLSHSYWSRHRAGRSRGGSARAAPRKRPLRSFSPRPAIAGTATSSMPISLMCKASANERSSRSRSPTMSTICRR
jgi:hypothetical protein